MWAGDSRLLGLNLRESADGPGLRSFRLVRLGFPREELRQLVAREACRRIIGHWLHGIPRRAHREEPPEAERVEESDTLGHTPPELDAGQFFAELELDEEKFLEAFLDRVERASGSDPLMSFQREARGLLEVWGREGAALALARYFDDMDGRFGPGTIEDEDHRPSSPFGQKLNNEFTHDRHELEIRLDTWVSRIVEDPDHRLKPARDGLNHLIERLVEQVEATPERIAAIRLRRDEIREHSLEKGSNPGSGQRRAFSHLLKTFPREASPRAEELCEYAQLLIQETALHIRAEILAALLARASQVGEGLIRLHQGLANVECSFAAKCPRFGKSERSTLGSSVESSPRADGPHGRAQGHTRRLVLE